MSSESQTRLLNGETHHHTGSNETLKVWDKQLQKVKENPDFHGDNLLADKQTKWTSWWYDLLRVFTPKNAPEVLKVAMVGIQQKRIDKVAFAQLIGSLPNDSKLRAKFVENAVKEKYEKMLHPPLTYLGDAFQFRAPDGKFNSVLHPHLGVAGAPYAKTVPSKTHPLGALPDPGDVFEKLMARGEGGRNSKSGLSSMLIYHATIIIHDIFRTNDTDKNISDSSSYLDLSPLYGYTMEMQKQVRDDKYKLGLLKPDTFAEDRLLRQPPGVCIMLVMYNRYHNYAATQLKRINENGKFSVPAMFKEPKWLAVADDPACVPTEKRKTAKFTEAAKEYERAWDVWCKQGRKPIDIHDTKYKDAERKMRDLVETEGDDKEIKTFCKQFDAAWDKLDDDLFNTARLITCGMYINISIHDYLRALMGFHQYNTNFTLEPRTALNKNVSRGLGNQVTVEFNLLYRFHCAISQKDEAYTEQFMWETWQQMNADQAKQDGSASKGPDLKKKDWESWVRNMPLQDFGKLGREMNKEAKKDPWLVEFGLRDDPNHTFRRNTVTGLFEDERMIEQLHKAMEDPISNFGPRNVPRCLKNVEIMGILQARKWEVGTLNDFRDFFGMKRHDSFESVTKNEEIQNALRDLYDHPDKIELYPGIFCESDDKMGVDPGPNEVDSALWVAIFSDAITLVRSDRFYTVDWNTNSLTSWGMKEVTPDNDICKSSIFHRLYQRAFPEWFPYDSIRFFHPFYTGQTNAKYAEQQGYKDLFKMTKQMPAKQGIEFNVKDSEPKKPSKPLFLTKYSDIEKVLSTGADEIIHPAFADAANLPKKVQQALQSIKSKRGFNEHENVDFENITKAYFTYRMKTIVEREVIPMSTGKTGSVYQLDVTRDLAIPVITRCIADFLGFGDQIRDVGNKGAKFSENEVYQHITNCQMFLSYNADETKLLKRRKDFMESMEFLLKLTESGNILEASRWRISRAVRDLGRGVASLLDWRLSADEKLTIVSMKILGRLVATRILHEVKDSGRAAAVLLLTALDIAYTSVLAFTASLDHLLQGAYNHVNVRADSTCDWFEIQKLALRGGAESDKAIQEKILKAQRLSIKTPLIRKVVKEGLRIHVNGKETKLGRGDIIVCDVHQAMNPKHRAEAEAVSKLPHLNYISSLSTGLVQFNPKDVAVDGLTTMIKVMAQMKNLRRSHTSQGVVKKIEIDQTNEGYANFMAPDRMHMIASDSKHAEEALEYFRHAYEYSEEPVRGMDPKHAAAKLEHLEQRAKDAKKIYSPKVLTPKQETYLSAEWDEMIPFPTTWKLRFEGYGASEYGGAGKPQLRTVPQPDWFPPFYQPSGPSHYGGTFGEMTIPLEELPASLVGVRMKGCGAPGLPRLSASNVGGY